LSYTRGAANVPHTAVRPAILLEYRPTYNGGSRAGMRCGKRARCGLRAP